MENIVKKLISRKETISTMESCTGGGVANAITNIENSSYVLKFSAVTYSNEFKIKFGVEKELIDEYSVYSIEVAKSMARNISAFTDSTYGVGITGKLNKSDPYNKEGIDNQVFISIYDKENDKYYNKDIYVTKNSRAKNKEEVIDVVRNLLENIL